MDDNYAVFFSCKPVSRASHCDGPDIFISFDWVFLPVALSTGVQLVISFARDVSKLFCALGSPSSDSLLNLCVIVFDSSWWLSRFICLSLIIH